ncbi:MAG: hypothetical protein BWY90_01562 [Deltaproteobacteria bacterium ADurb.BinA014]|nr:MAG: hypothetical protein BWY90_01562 [Deltaproteobacteria bacterium ADurb.BinA014]
MVSVSLCALPPHLGHFVSTNSLSAAKGEPPSELNFTFSGRITGKSFSGTGTMPHLAQLIMGIGAPQ